MEWAVSKCVKREKMESAYDYIVHPAGDRSESAHITIRFQDGQYKGKHVWTSWGLTDLETLKLDSFILEEVEKILKQI